MSSLSDTIARAEKEANEVHLEVQRAQVRTESATERLLKDAHVASDSSAKHAFWLQDASTVEEVHMVQEKVDNELNATRLQYKENQAFSDEETAKWLEAHDFSTTEAYEAFRAVGGWSSLPNAVTVRCDLRGLTSADMVSSKFKASFVLYSSNFLNASSINYTCRTSTGDPFRFHDYKKGPDDSQGTHSDASAFNWQYQHAENPVMEFFEDFELHNFPFDVQFCSIVVTCDTKGKFLIPVPGMLNQAMVLDQFHMLRPKIDCYESSKGPRTTAVFRMTLQRKWEWYVVNHLIKSFLITSVIFYTFLIDLTEMSSRIGVSLSLLLTMMATKLVMAGSMPKLAHMTTFDYYMMACFGIILVVIAWNCSAHFLLSHEYAFWIDYMMSLLLLLFWGGYNLYYVTSACSRLRRIRESFGPPLDQLPYDLNPAVVKVSADDFI